MKVIMTYEGYKICLSIKTFIHLILSLVEIPYIYIEQKRERPHSLSLAETEWGERIYIEGAQVKVVELVRSAWQAGEQENQERTMTRGGRLTIE